MAPNAETYRLTQALTLGAALMAIAVASPSAGENLPTPEQLIRQSGFHCGKEFITVPDEDSYLWTVRKGDIATTQGFNGHMFTMLVMPSGVDHFRLKIPGSYRRFVTECLD